MNNPPTDPPISDRAPIIPAESGFQRLKRRVFGGPKNLYDKAIFHQLTLISLLAWIGLGGDALSSASYGPQESIAVIKGHPHLVVALALATAATVFIISTAYSKLIELFPNGGGYGVATRLLGQRVGMISGCALLVDYVLTIAVSITACSLAIFSFLPLEWFVPDPAWVHEVAQLQRVAADKIPALTHDLTIASRNHWMLGVDITAIVGLMALNLRGVKESIVMLTPIFLVFVITHVILLGAGFLLHIPQMPETAQVVADGFHSDLGTIGLSGMALLLVSAYAMGGGTYTGIEAVSNALPLMREPRVQTAKRTMLYMAISLAVMASGLLMCYLLWNIQPSEGGKTMNAMLAEAVAVHFPAGKWFVVITLLSEGALLVVAAQTGFIGGPRVLANMAVDSWTPRRFASLSERLTTENGIVIMGVAALGMVLYAQGKISVLIVIYSINVFLSFALTMLGMTLLWLRRRAEPAIRFRRVALFGTGFALCATILIFTCWSQFQNGGSLALVVTGGLATLCLLIRSHYHLVNNKVAKLYATLGNLPPASTVSPGEPDAKQPTAVVLVGSFGGLGIHTTLNLFRAFPHHFKNLVFVSVGVVDSGDFKGADTVDELHKRTEETLAKYVAMANGMGIPASARFAVGTDAVEEATRLCLEVSKDFPKSTFFAGKIIFQRELWYQWLLHNDTAFSVQKRLHWEGKTMVVLPARIR